MQTPLAPRIMPYHSQRQCKMLTLRYITMENFKINTTCTYALKRDHAGFTGFYTRNCAIVLLVYENVRFRSFFIFTMDACARAFHNSLANWVF